MIEIIATHRLTVIHYLYSRTIITKLFKNHWRSVDNDPVLSFAAAQSPGLNSEDVKKVAALVFKFVAGNVKRINQDHVTTAINTFDESNPGKYDNT